MSPVNQVNKTNRSGNNAQKKILLPDHATFWENKSLKVSEKPVTASDLKTYPGLRFEIAVRDSNNQEFLLVVTGMNTIKDIKSIIELRVGVPIKQQVLIGEKLKQELEDKHNLAYYEFQENSTVWVLSPVLKLLVKMPQVGRELELNAYGFNAIGYIKEMICDAMGVPMDKQNLVYEGKSMSNGGILSDYDIQRNSTLYVVFGMENPTKALKFKLIIHGATTNDFELQVCPFNSVLDIKTLIESKVGLPIALQKIMYDEKNLKDWKLMVDYDIQEGSKIDVEKFSSDLKIHVRTSDQLKNVITLAVKDSTTIEEIMDMLPLEMENTTRCFGLFFGETRLQDEETLAHYNITSGTFLSVERAIHINVSILSGEIVGVDLKLSDDIDDVKAKIEEACGIPEQLQTLTYLDDELEDSYTLEDYATHLENLWVLRWCCGGKSCSFFWPNYAGKTGRKQIN